MMFGNKKGFLILEVFIAGLILTSSIAAAMFLFKVGFEGLQRANDSNILSSKLYQAVNLLKAVDLEMKNGEEYMGDDVSMQWEAKLIEKTRPVHKTPEGSVQAIHELYLYSVNLRLKYKDIVREYNINVFRYKTPYAVSEF